MTRSLLEFELSTWWIPVLALIAALLAFLLYAKKNVPWNTVQNWMLFAIRTLALFMILLLLLSPSMKRIVNTLEKPLVILAIDNSQSITARGVDSTKVKHAISSISEELQAQDLQVKTVSFSTDDSLNFGESTTRLSSLLLEAEESSREENMVATLLVTDGIFNRGSSPLYRNYLHPIFTVGMGDTIPPKDISISRTRYNRVTFKGNETPIRLEINQQGYKENTVVRLTENGDVVMEKPLKLDRELQEITFLITSDKEGLRHLVASVPVAAEESTDENNSVDIFLEVIDGRQKVLLVGNAPHPDISAIRRSLEETDSYVTDLYIPSLADEAPKEIYDVVIYHGAFNGQNTFVPKEQPGVWYILNSSSSFSLLNKEVSYLSIERRSSEPDLVTGSFNQSFSKFKVEETGAFEEFPPIEVPFGDYDVSAGVEVLMYQKLGGVVTRKPLMIVNDDGTKKSALLMGQNIWRWKLQESAVNDNSNQFDNLITKTIQFLSVKNDKKQFRFVARKTIFSNSQPVLFDAEVYNDIYERIYNNPIEITITDESGTSNSYNFTDSERLTSFRAPNLAPGIYRFSAQVQIGSKLFTERGEFLVEYVNTEYLDLTANHRLLRNLSQKTNGEFLHYDEIEALPEVIKNQDFKPVMRSEEDTKSLHRSIGYFLIIFFLFSTEWVLRRYWGGY